MTYTIGEISTQQWIENLRLPDGKPPRLDMYGHNPFSSRAPNLSNPPSPKQEFDFSDLGQLSKLVDRYLGRPGNPDPKLFLSEWTVPTKVDLEFNLLRRTAPSGPVDHRRAARRQRTPERLRGRVDPHL